MINSSKIEFLHLVDDRPLPLAMLEAFLGRWASKAGLQIIKSSRSDIVPAAPEHPALVVYNIGSDKFSETSACAVPLLMLSNSCPDCRLVVFSEKSDLSDVYAAWKLGVKAYILTKISPDCVFNILEFVLKGGTYFPPHAMEAIDDETQGSEPPEPDARKPGQSNAGRGAPERRETPEERRGVEENGSTIESADPPVGGTASLTGRQREVLHQLGMGKSNKEIARYLDVSEATVKVHVRQVMKKLGAANRTQAAVMASQLSPSRLDPAPQKAPATSLHALPELHLEKLS